MRWYHRGSTAVTAVETPRDRRRVGSLLFRDCTAIVLRRHGCDGGATASLYGATAVMAVPRQCCGGNGGAAAIPLTLAQPAVALRKFCTCSKFPRRSAMLTVFRGATAINDGTTAIMAVQLRFMLYKHRSCTAPPV